MRVRERIVPSARPVPSAVATTVVIAAISIDANSDSRSESSRQNSSYQRSESPSSTCSDFAPLNENSTTTAIGANRNT